MVIVVRIKDRVVENNGINSEDPNVDVRKLVKVSRADTIFRLFLVDSEVDSTVVIVNYFTEEEILQINNLSAPFRVVNDYTFLIYLLGLWD